MAIHEQSVGASDEWYTPPEVFEALGERFDLDVASPGPWRTPWIPVDAYITHDSLRRSWGKAFVWMNPPFGPRNGIIPWLQKFFAHRDGIALVPDRTSAPWWQTHVAQSDAALFVEKKLKFLTPDPILGSRKNKDGSRTPQPSQFQGLFLGTQPAQGTTLFAVGKRAVRALERAQSAGLGFVLYPKALV